MNGFRRLALSRLMELAAAVLCVLHVVLVLRQYPVSALFSLHPLTGGDLTLHFAPCHLGRQLLDAGGGLWGYVPQFMAGYPFGAWDSFTQRGYEYCTLLFPGLSVAGAFHAYLMVTALLPPFLVALAARVLGLGRTDVLLTLCLAVIYYQVDNMLSFFWTFGNTGFPFVNALGVLYIAFAWKGIADRRRPHTLAAGLLLALVGWLHQMVVLPLAAGSLVVVALQGRALWRERRLLYALAIPAVALGLLAPWLHVLWHFREWRVPRETPALRSGLPYLVMDFFSDRAYRHHFDRRTLFHIQIVLATLGVIGAAGARRRAVLALALTGAAALASAYLFSYSGFLKETEPYRYLVSFALLAIIPAAVGAGEAGRLLRGADRAVRLAAGFLALALLPSLTAYGFDFLQREPMRKLNEESRSVLEWLRTRARPEGRVLCHDDAMADVLPYYTGLEVLGGAMTRCSPLAHRAAWMRGRRWLTAEASAETLPEFEAYLSRYNVAYVILPSDRLAPLMLRIPGMRACFSAGRYRVFMRDPAACSYVADAPAGVRTRVRAEVNRLRVEDAPAGRFTLKYHFVDTLRAPAGVRLFPVPVADDPAPFIGVENERGLKTFDIRNTGRLF